ncbi:hypothetical protein GA0115240_172026 [Streptomyces sp. DvalAA-14]|nr:MULTISPECIES: hypothetical protein [unclassified Streptomyces]SCE50982.1 hypothetical protein GA0115240_172026 [Streptomyces sp. DvalAA-14]
MGRPGDWHILDLDRDPTPGDPSRVKALSLQLHDFADDVESALRLVKGMQSEDAILSWAGLSADAFRDEFGSAPKNLDKLHTSYRLAADALEAYWPDLEHAQSQADRALADGRTAHAQLTAAQGGLNGAQNWVHTAAATADTYDPAKNPGKTVPPPDSDQVRQATRDLAAAKAQQAHAQQAVTSAQSALDAAKRLAEQARGLREDAARRTVTKLHEASDAGIKNRHWWEKAVHWVADHWDDIVTVCKWIVAILGIVVMIIGGPLAWLVVAAALLVLADTISKYIQGKATLWDVLFAALDCIPMTKGLTSLGKLAELYKAGGLLRIGAEGVKGAITGLKDMAAAIRGLGNGARIIVKGLPDALRDIVKVAVTPEGIAIPVADFGGVKALMTAASQAGGGGRRTWQVGEDVAGPARGKTLRAPHPRHTFSGINLKNVQAENSLVLPEARQAVDGDIEAIAAGQARFNAETGRYEVNGRSYGVEDTGTVFPDSGPGIVKIGRVEYSALAMIKKAGGDMSKVERAFANDPKFVNNPQAVQTALDLYRTYTR